jgi:tRNA dimethylallyltransferase
MNIIIITGQTATGKTQLALNYAKKYDGELINCDSRQVYKYLDIITGKDLTDNTFHKKYTLHHLTIGHYNLQTTHYQLPTIPIWLYDIVDPKDNFSSFDFQLCAIEVLKDIISRGKTPIIVGGTYFYLKHLLYHNQGENIMPNWQLRGDLENKSVEELQHLLQQYDQELFDEMNDSDRQNPRRLMRKIEMAMAGEEP